MENNLIDLLTFANAKIAASDIVKHFIDNGTEETIEIDYKITMGKASSCETNTSYSFNFPKGSLLYNISTVAKKIEELSDEEHDALLSFENIIIKEIKEQHFDKIKGKLRYFTPLDHNAMAKINPMVRQQILETIFPMTNSNILSCVLKFLFDPDGDDGYTLKVEKNSPRLGTSTTAISVDLIKRHTETGNTFEEIIKEQKEAGNEQYKYVVKAFKKYYDAQCTISFHVDYSPAPKEEVDERMKELLG